MKYRRIVTASLIAVPLIAGVAAYVANQNESAAASRSESPATVSAPAAAPPSPDTNATGVPFNTIHATPIQGKQPQTKEQKSEDGPAYVKEIDSASFPQVVHLAVASDSERLPNEDSAHFSIGRFASPLMLTYPGGLGGGHRQPSHRGSNANESGSLTNVPSSDGAGDAKNAPSPSSLTQGPSNNSEHHDSHPSNSRDDNRDDTAADNSPHNSNHDDDSSHDANGPSHDHDGDSQNPPSDEQPIPQLVFDDQPQGDQPIQVPEPGTLGLLGIGVLGLARRRKVQK